VEQLAAQAAKETNDPTLRQLQQQAQQKWPSEQKSEAAQLAAEIVRQLATEPDSPRTVRRLPAASPAFRRRREGSRGAATAFAERAREHAETMKMRPTKPSVSQPELEKGCAVS